jgi:energy-coupling factor transport system permease protein
MRTYDVRAWVVWLITGALLAIFTRNPFYLVILLTISRIVMAACASPEATKWRLPFWRLAGVILLFSTLFNWLIAHLGQTVIFTLPANWPLVGGPLTLEAAAYGFLSGLSLVVLLAIFMTFNAVVPVHQLTRLVPGALHEMGIVMLVAVTYVPETTRQFQRIREAQAIRGHRLRTLRDWRPIVIPLLIGGLERAMNLAETMVARGYGSTVQVRLSNKTRLLLVAGSLLFLVGSLRVAWQATDGWVMLFMGAVSIGLVYRFSSRENARTNYRPLTWSWADSIVILFAIGTLVLLIGSVTVIERSVLAYSPYPRLLLPAFEWWVGMSLLGLLMPALLVLVP